jgi:hypothetical protein
MQKLNFAVPKLQEIGTGSAECAFKCILVVLDGWMNRLMQRYALHHKKGYLLLW